MKLSKLLIAGVGATALLAASVSSASAGRLSFSATSASATWTTMTFSGGIGTVQCEVILNGTLHSRTMHKIRLSLMGYITAGNVTRCARGGATILRETLPWHVRYESFGGTLPNITTVNTIVVGFALRIREPTFGIECLLRSTPEEPMTLQYNLNGSRQLASATVGGTIRCGGFSGSLSGTSSSIAEAGGARVTVTLI